MIGAGKMGALTAKLLRRDGVAELFIANRTLAHGEKLATQVAGRAVPLAAVPELLGRVELAFGATDAPRHVVEATTSGLVLDARGSMLLLIDLGVPRSIDPRLGELPQVRLLDVDDVAPVVADERRRAEVDIRQAELIIEAAVAAFGHWWAARPVTPAIASLQHRAELIRTAELERALRKLGHLSERDREVVKALSVGIVNKLLHQPVTRLRHAAGDDPAIGTVIELFGAAAATEPSSVCPEEAPVGPGERTG